MPKHRRQQSLLKHQHICALHQPCAHQKKNEYQSQQPQQPQQHMTVTAAPATCDSPHVMLCLWHSGCSRPVARTVLGLTTNTAIAMAAFAGWGGTGCYTAAGQHIAVPLADTKQPCSCPVQESSFYALMILTRLPHVLATKQHQQQCCRPMLVICHSLRLVGTYSFRNQGAILHTYSLRQCPIIIGATL
jgi:hypothetical protein